jgi:hypothetical protein
MVKYSMPLPKAWVDAQTESRFDLYTPLRQHGDDAFTRFADVLRRSNPLLPPVITGPLCTLPDRVLAQWETVSPEGVEFHQEKHELLDAFCIHVKNLPIFSGRNITPDRAPLEGLEFYSRPPSRDPDDSPFPYAKRDDRLEATESLYFITIILSTGEKTPVVSKMHEGYVNYLPYATVPRYLTSPQRCNSASLALAARFFRLNDKRPEPKRRVFRFDISIAEWETPERSRGAGEAANAATDGSQEAVASTGDEVLTAGSD